MMGSPRKILSRETKWPNLCSERSFRFLEKMRLEVQRHGSGSCRLQGTEDRAMSMERGRGLEEDIERRTSSYLSMCWLCGVR